MTSFDVPRETSSPTVTVTVMAEIEPSKALEVYRNRRDYMRVYMRDYRHGKRRSKVEE